MEHDFFEDDNQQNTGENDVQRVPAPVKKEESAQKPKRKTGKILLTVLLALVVFLGGMTTTWFLLDPEMRTLVKVKNRIQNKYYKEITDDQFYKAIFGGINDDLLDAYSRYRTPEEFETMLSEMEGNRLGVGLSFAAVETEPLRITRVCGNSPAEAAGVVAGEKITGVGKTENEIAPCSTFEEFSACLGDYKEDENFFLQLEKNGERRIVSLHKAAYVENCVFYRTNTKSYTFTGERADVLTEKGLPLTYLDNDTAYIRLVQFTGNAAKEFDLAMEQFQKDGKKNLILDLRENGGGYVDVMQSIASYFCKDATNDRPIIAVADFGDKGRVSYRADGNYYDEYFAEDSRICVIADRYTASASECLLGCMLDYGTISYADICLIERNGVAKTYGKGIMQETFYVNLFAQDAITLTTAEIRWPVSDNSIHGRGILLEDGALTLAGNIDYEKEIEGAVNTLLG